MMTLMSKLSSNLMEDSGLATENLNFDQEHVDMLESVLKTMAPHIKGVCQTVQSTVTSADSAEISKGLTESISKVVADSLLPVFTKQHTSIQPANKKRCV